MIIRLVLVLTFSLFCVKAQAQELTIQTAAPSQELLWKAEALENKTKYLPKEQQDWNAVASAYKAAADAGHPDAMAFYARTLNFLGKTAEAEVWFKKSADEGSTFGQFNLGSILFNKSRANCPQTVYLYKKSADNGNPDAIAALGYFYKDAICGPVPKPETEKYLKLGVERGNPVSLYNYAVFLQEHNFFGKNDELSMIYFYLASKNVSSALKFNIDEKVAKQKAAILISKLQTANKLPKAYQKFRQICSQTGACNYVEWQLLEKIRKGSFESENGFAELLK